MPYSGKSKRRFYRKSRKTYVPRSVKSYITKTLDKSIEDKHIVRNLTDWNSISTSWSEFNMSSMAQGTGGEYRIGRRIKIKSLLIKGVLCSGVNQTSLDDAYNVVRIVIGTFTFGSGTTPLASYAITINQPIDSTVGVAAVQKLYLDKYITLNCSTNEKGPGDGYAPVLKNFNYYKKFKKPIYINFADDTATTPNKRLFFSLISDSVAVPHPGFINGYIYMRYEDA